MRTLNLGILAHVDAGKTSLTERLLFGAGVIGEIGRVDEGNTQTDSLPLERQRGITIKSAVVSFTIGDVAVNLIDTPGHPDFIAEVERVLSVLDGAVLVISAVEGVQAQTRTLMRTLRRLRIPALIFVNKIDRGGAGDERVLHEIAEKLTPDIVAMGTPSGLGTRGAGFSPYGPRDAAFVDRLADLLAEHDDAFLAAYVADETAVSYRQVRDGLARQARLGRAHPVFFGSAITGAGAGALAAGITEFLPAARGDADGPVSGTVFKVERGPAGEKIAYVRMFSGTLRVRDRPPVGGDRAGKVTAIRVFDRGSAVPRGSVAAGHIGQLWGLSGVQIGDTLGPGRPVADRGRLAGSPGRPAVDPGRAVAGMGRAAAGPGRPVAGPGRAVAGPGTLEFGPPTLETVVVPGRPAQKGALHAALTQLAEQDPLINLRQDDIRQELLVSLYGEVQKEVIQATLADEFGIGVAFRESTTICIERPAGTGAAVELIGQEGNPFLAAVGLRIDPAAAGSGVRFGLEIELGALPLAFLKAVEETVQETLRQGIYGWEVTDCTVTMTHSGYCPRQSHAHATFDKSMSSTGRDFRGLTPLVVMSALQQAGTIVYEPMHRFRLEVPAEVAGAMMPVLARLRAQPDMPVTRGSSCLLTGEIPAARVHELEQQLPGLARGEGVMESAFNRYRAVRGVIPSRPRSDHNPLNRREYLLRVTRGVSAER